MAFGQQAGPPASPRQIRELLALLQDAGHTDFCDARGPMGLTQRQAAGKFTREEAAALIDRLENAATNDDPSPDAEPVRRLSATAKALARVTTEDLAAELQRRGWIVVEP